MKQKTIMLVAHARFCFLYTIWKRNSSNYQEILCILWPWVCQNIVSTFSSVQSLSCVWLCDPMDPTPGFPVHHQLTPEAYLNSCPLSRWWHPTISSSVVPFSPCLQSFPASGSFPMSQFFPSTSQQWLISFYGFKSDGLENSESSGSLKW